MSALFQCWVAPLQSIQSGNRSRAAPKGTGVLVAPRLTKQASGLSAHEILMPPCQHTAIKSQRN